MNDNDNDNAGINNSNSSNSETLNLDHLNELKQLTFDYEINHIRLDDTTNNTCNTCNNNNNALNCKMYYFDKEHNEDRIVNYNNFKDSLKPAPYTSTTTSNVFKASFIKQLVSKKKIRFQNADFNLDMAYITDRVIAMGFPSVNYERIYRNSIADVIAFFEKYHKSNVKIYNLCLEKDRIYNKALFGKAKVGLFPSLDHNPCPVKLILEFCVDICLFLILNLESVAAIHCKAGKGRTGVMICSYLVFSGLCRSTHEAIAYYGRMRTINGRGVTIPSQVRYVKYFETFLNSNFYAPFIYLIPKIIKEHLFIRNQPRLEVKNLLRNLAEDPRYISSPNCFRINSVKVGPLRCEKAIEVSVYSMNNKKFVFADEHGEIVRDGVDAVYYVYRTNSVDYPIHSDIKIVFNKAVKCYVCLNLWYSALETIEEFMKAKSAHEGDNKQRKDNKNDNEFVNGFMIFDEEEMEVDDNCKKDFRMVIHENEGEYKGGGTGMITSHVQYNAELNEIITELNKIRSKKGKSVFDKGNMVVKLNAAQLDKFAQVKDMQDLTVEINYSLL